MMPYMKPVSNEENNIMREGGEGVERRAKKAGNNE